MNLRTKIITTIIAMACSLSVSISGIVAIMVQFPTQVKNATMLNLVIPNGDLYGRRIGADNHDIQVAHLFKAGSEAPTAELAEFCEDVSFSQNSKQIEYVLLFKLSEGEENGVIIKQTEAFLSDNVAFESSYKIGFGQEEPNWDVAEDIIIFQNYMSGPSNPIVWIRATLSIKSDAVVRLSGTTTWSFSFTFEGFERSN